jgi:hypothetical protein
MEELDSETFTPGLIFRLTVTSPTVSELTVLFVRSESLEQEPITTIAVKAAILKMIFFIFFVFLIKKGTGVLPIPFLKVNYMLPCISCD